MNEVHLLLMKVLCMDVHVTIRWTSFLCWFFRDCLLSHCSPCPIVPHSALLLACASWHSGSAIEAPKLLNTIVPWCSIGFTEYAPLFIIQTNCWKYWFSIMFLECWSKIFYFQEFITLQECSSFCTMSITYLGNFALNAENISIAFQ